MGVGLFRGLTTFSGPLSSLENESTRLGGGGLGDDDDEDDGLALLALLLEGSGEKLPGALAGGRVGCIFGA